MDPNSISALSAISSNNISRLGGFSSGSGASGALGSTRQESASGALGSVSQSNGGLLVTQFRTLAASDGLDALATKLKALDVAAGKLTLNSDSVFMDGDSAWSSDSDVVRIDSAPTNLTSSLEVNVLQLANANTGQEAIIEINGEQFTSATNEFTDAGGIDGLDLTVLRTTAQSITTTTVTPGTTTTTFSDAVSVESVNDSAEKLRLADSEDVEFDSGDAVQVFGSGISGVSEDTTYYVKIDGDDVRLYDTQDNASQGGSEGRIDIGTGSSSGFEEVSGVSIAKVTTVTTPDVVTTTVKTVAADPVTIRRSAAPNEVAGAIRDFVAAYNDVQEFISDQTGAGGALSGERQVGRLDAQLRRAFGPLFTKPALDGIASGGGTGSQISFDSDKLGEALATDFETVARAFTDVPSGIASRTATALDPFLGSQGILAERSAALGATLSGADLQSLRDAQKQLDGTSSSLDSIAGAMLAVQEQTGFLSSLSTRLL
jgi:flagellar capping protein FliD